MLEDSGRFVVCADVSDASAAVDSARREKPDICLLDIRMPGNGIAADCPDQGRSTRSRPIVMLTVSRADDDLFDALRAGAKGYLLKGMGEDELPDALDRVMNGQASLPANLVARLIDEFRDRERFRVNLPGDRAVLLTPREWDVLGLMRSARPPQRSPNVCSSQRRPFAPTFRRSFASSRSTTDPRPSASTKQIKPRVAGFGLMRRLA